MGVDVKPEHTKRAIELEQVRAPTMRERFAMAALTGLLASGVILDNFEDYADAAWRHADSCLKRKPLKVTHG